MFKKYTSIENAYRESYLDRIKGHGFWRSIYVVQEKVHGSNLSFHSENGVDFKAAKRSGLIGEGERFYNHERLLAQHLTAFQNIWQTLIIQFPEMNLLSIYGEVCGGQYQHPEVPKNAQALKVQKGIQYGPDNYFYAFDILVNGDTYIDMDVTVSLFEENKLLHAPTLFEGELEDCLAYSNEFNSKIPEILGLPDIGENICEGTVIKPLKALFLNNGQRVIIKNKNDKWKESKAFTKKIRQEEPVSEQVAKLREAILLYATDNRLNNVLSHIGEVTIKDFGRVLGLYNKDIVTDFQKDYEEIIDVLDKKEWKQVTKSLGHTTTKIVRNYLVKL